MENPEDTPAIDPPESNTRRSSSGAILGVIAGLGLFPLTYLLFWEIESPTAASILISSALMFLAAANGAVAAARTDWSGYSRGTALATATRIGALAGFVVFLIGGGMAILATTLHILAAGVEPGTTDWQRPSYIGSTSVFLTLVPMAALGSATCALVTLTKLPPPEQLGDSATDPPEQVDPPRTGTNRILPWAAIIFVVCMLSPTVPSILAAREVEPEPIAETPPETDSEEEDQIEEEPEHEPDEPAPPPFRYSRPAELSTASSSAWTVTARKILPDFDSRGPALISPDSRYLAYTPTSRQVTFSIHDFETDKLVHSIRTASSVTDFSWSPDSRRLFCVCGSEESRFQIVEVESGRSTTLPVPFGLWKLEGKPWWWSEHEVAFIDDQEVRSWLDLETLRLRQPEESAHWQKTEKETGITPFGPPPQLADTTRCQLAILPQVKAYVSPLEEQRSRWVFDVDPALGVLDKKTGTTKHLISRQFQERARFLSAPDASKVVVVTTNSTSVYYFDTEDPAKRNFTATLPDPERLTADPSFAQLLRSPRLAAMVCAPLVNPLNKKVIGPDRRKAKGVVRILDWEGTSATLEVMDEYWEIQEGDILTDIHTWKIGATILINAEPLNDWWTPLKPSTDPPQIDDKVTRPTRWARVPLSPTNTGLEFQGWSSLSSNRSSPSMLIVAIETGEPDEPEDDVEPAPTQSDRAKPETTAQLKITSERRRAISEFIKAHHKKITMEDLDGFTRDYASQVDLFDQGQVDRAYIRKAQADYYPKYTFLAEVVEGEPVITTVAGAYRVVYQMRSIAVSNEQKKSDNIVEVTLDLRNRNGNLEIIRQRGRLVKKK